MAFQKTLVLASLVAGAVAGDPRKTALDAAPSKSPWKGPSSKAKVPATFGTAANTLFWNTAEGPNGGLYSISFDANGAVQSFVGFDAAGSNVYTLNKANWEAADEIMGKPEGEYHVLNSKGQMLWDLTAKVFQKEDMTVDTEKLKAAKETTPEGLPCWPLRFGTSVSVVAIGERSEVNGAAGIAFYDGDDMEQAKNLWLYLGEDAEGIIDIKAYTSSYDANTILDTPAIKSTNKEATIAAIAAFIAKKDDDCCSVTLAVLGALFLVAGITAILVVCLCCGEASDEEDLDENADDL